MSLGALSPTHWCEAPCALLITFDIFLLELPPPALGWWFGRSVRPRVLRRTVRLVSTGKACIGIWQLRSSGDWTRHTNPGDTTANTRKHASKFALDARLSCRARQLCLCPLHCLRQWGYSTLAVDLLNRQQVPLSIVRMFLHRAITGRVNERWSAVWSIVCNRRRRWTFLHGATMRRRRLGLGREMTYSLSLRRIEGLLRRRLLLTGSRLLRMALWGIAISWRRVRVLRSRRGMALIRVAWR